MPLNIRSLYFYITVSFFESVFYGNCEGPRFGQNVDDRITFNGHNGLSPILLSGGTSVGHGGLQLDLRWPNANAVSNLGAVGG